MTRLNTQFSVKGISLLNSMMSSSSSAQFSLNSICAIKSTISLEIKCPQLSKPEAARNQNSIGDRMEKKPWEKPGSVGRPVLLWPDEPAVCSNCSKVRLCKGLIWFPRSCPDGCLGQVKSSHLYLYSAFNNTNCDKATAQYQNGKIVSIM